MNDETLAFALIVASATASQLIAARLALPAIVPLLIAGVLLGESVTGIIDPVDLLGDLREPFVNLAVAVILFDGALSLRRSDLAGRGTGPLVGRLVTIGVLITWVLATLAAWLILGIDWRIALILGAVLTLSGPTVVLPLIEFVRPNRELATVLRWEGILIDPVGAILAVLTFHAVASGGGDLEPGTFLGTIAVGAAIGVVAALLLQPIVNSPRFTHALKSITTLGVVLTASAVASIVFDDAGLVAAVALGAMLANSAEQVARETEIFTETLVALLIGALFIVLAADVEIGDVTALGIEGLLFAAALILLIRPISSSVCALGSGMARNERAFLAWMMPRGIVAAATVAAFQIDLQQAGVPDAEVLIPATFLVIAVTVAVYGLTARPVAERLGVTADDEPAAAARGGTGS
jgi:NhaP-type Na+/H+ or K+/H+ antiporter